LLVREIELHRQTDKALQDAKLLAERARQQAEQANQAKSRYISAISHELRTPLNSILGYAQLMGEDASIPPHRKQAVSVIKRGGEHLLSLIEGTLDMAHIESGKLTLNPKPMSFARAMEDMAAMFELQAQEKSLAFTYEVLGMLPQWVRADDKRVRQILFNLLGNAIKFTQRGEVRLRLRYAREMAHVEIHDTGPGMSAAELERVFEPFTRGESAAYAAAGATASSGGSGLGLTIAKMLTDLMGGELTATSSQGAGSVFKVRLFLPEIHIAGDTAPDHFGSGQGGSLSDRPRKGYAGARRKILVVDNEEADRGVLLNLLQPLGFEIRVAASGHDGLDLMASGLQPDAVLLDLAMPGIDGWETLRRMRAMGGRQPGVAIVSANAFDRGLDNGLGIAPDDFILKPVRHSELLDWLERKLELVWLSEEIAAPENSDSPASLPSGVSHTAQPAGSKTPPRSDLMDLQALVHLGYPRGILNKIAALDIAHPGCQAFTAPLEALTRKYQFEAVLERIQKVLDEPQAH
jgi:CheY-like chemotaxis protein